MKHLMLLMILGTLVNNGYAQTSSYDSIPVRISVLSASNANNNIRLDWKVVCFLDYARFDIQRSVNGIEYATIKTFEADRLRCRQPFDFTDNGVTGKFFYRINVGDLDGRYYHSQIVVAGKQASFQIYSLAPTVVRNRANLRIESAIQDRASVIISNYQGVIVRRWTTQLNKGISDVPLSTSQLASGIYQLSIENTAQDRQSIRFVKQ